MIPRCCCCSASAAAYALYQLATRGAGDRLFRSRRLAGDELCAAFRLVPPQSLFGLLLFASLGLLGGAGHYLVIYAFQSGPAAVIAPFGDVELIGTATLGYFIFGNFPDLRTWLGAAVIIALGLYIALRERQLRAR
jgi:drug/metabolite transporter (DMT)-like permease